MSKVMRQMVKQRSNSSHQGYYPPMRAPGPDPRGGGGGGNGGKSSMFTRDISFSESEIQTQIGFSDSEEEKSEVIDDFLDDEDEQDDREDELIQSEFEEGDDDDEDEEEGNDPFQRQLGYPPLPRYKTPTPANPLDKLGTLTPMEEMTEPPSSGANSPASFAIPGHRSKSRGPSNLTLDHSGMDMSRSPSRSSKKNLGLETVNERSPSRSSMNNLTVDHGGRSRAQSRTSMRGSSPTPSKSPSRQGMNDYGKSGQSRSDFPPSDFPTSAMSRSDYPPSDYPKTPGKSGKRHEFLPSTMDEEDFAPDSGHGDMGKSSRNLSSPDSMLSFRGDTMKKRKSGSSGIGSGGGMDGGSGSGSRSNLLNKSPKRTSTPLPKFESEMDSDINTLGLQSDANTLDDTEEMEKMRSFDRVRSWQRHAGGSSPPVYSAMADAEFASALDGMIMKLHGSKVDWEYRVKLADDLTAALKNVSPQVLLKNMSQIIPLVSNIAAENHFRVSLSILSTITMLGDRLRDCKSFLGSKSIPNADLTWLIRRLCTVCGESRSTLRTEGALALSHLIKGAGPELVCEPLYLILSSESKKHLNGTGRLTAGPRIKAAALDALTFALLTFPRDDFDLPTLAKHACKSLWNSKRRVRQASLECLAVLAHALGPSVALPLFRNYIEETKMELSSSSSSSGTMKRGATNYAPIATPSSAVSARVSRHLLPSPSPAGLVEYAVMIPQRTLQQSSYESGKGKGGLDPILNANGSGKNRHSAMVGADIAWILAGTGPTVNSTFYSPGSNLDW
ncbi:unnamed protein product [Allacma fusca]|uniref:TOG domain-containing protein n=1 Tax=Allacma fusca TaxID=39272 RepID=A0A8J2P2V1_9HEXA|nr:unnamed protein product [Allacma fusca]